MKAQKTSTKEQPWRINDVERMKDQRIGTRDKEYSQKWMRKIEQLHMDKVDDCKEDGLHMGSLFSGLSKTLEHLGFMEFEGGTKMCEREDDCSSRSKTGP